MEKYVADMHIHSEYSYDSKLPIKNLVEIEKEKGAKVIAITDHIEFSMDNMLTIIRNLCEREREIESIQSDNDILILSGIEVSEPHLYEKAFSYLRELSFIDYVLGSIHHINGKKLIHYKDDVDEYLRCILNMVMNSNIDTLAHMDYLKKYGTTNQFDNGLIDEILNVIIDKNITLELNSSGYRRCGSLFPSEYILSRYKELGGENVVIGSDAHRENELYNGIDKAASKAKQLGLKKGIIINGQFKSI